MIKTKNQKQCLAARTTKRKKPKTKNYPETTLFGAFEHDAMTEHTLLPIHCDFDTGTGGIAFRSQVSRVQVHSLREVGCREIEGGRSWMHDVLIQWSVLEFGKTALEVDFLAMC